MLQQKHVRPWYRTAQKGAWEIFDIRQNMFVYINIDRVKQFHALYDKVLSMENKLWATTFEKGLDQIAIYKILMERWTFNESDKIEIRLPRYRYTWKRY